MLNRRMTAVFMAILFTVSSCVPMSSLNAYAADNSDEAITGSALEESDTSDDENNSEVDEENNIEDPSLDVNKTDDTEDASIASSSSNSDEEEEANTESETIDDNDALEFDISDASDVADTEKGTALEGTTDSEDVIISPEIDEAADKEAKADGNGEVFGYCGSGDLTAMQWEIEDGVLTFTGSGEMCSYASAEDLPWYPYADTLDMVYIDEGVTGLDLHTFVGMVNLTQVVVSDNNTSFYSGGDYLCTDNNETLLLYLSAYGAEEIEIPEGIVTIESYAINWPEVNLNALYLPDGLQQINDHAITLNSVDCVYYNADKETADAGFSHVGNECLFSNCDWFYEQGDILAEGTIEYNTMWQCTRDGELTVTVANNDRIPDYASDHWNSDYLGIDVVRASIDGTPSAIGIGAFSGLNHLASIELPEGLTAIDDRAFEACMDLSDIVLPESLVSIGDSVFMACDNITEITIPASVTSIGCGFVSSTSLERIDVAQGNTAYKSENGVLYSIDGSELLVYPYCLSESKDSVFVEGTTTVIKQNAFDGWYVAETNISYVYFDGIQSDLNTLKQNVETGNEPLDQAIFLLARCGDNLNWTIDDQGILTISGTGEMWDFSVIMDDHGMNGENAAPWFLGGFNVNEVVIENGVTSIGAFAFFSLWEVERITIPESVEEIREYALADLPFLSEIVLSPENMYYCVEDGVLFNSDKTTLIVYPIGLEANSYTIPDTVVTIGYGAFMYFNYNKDRLDIYIPKSVLYINDYGFFMSSAYEFHPYYNGTAEEWRNITFGLNAWRRGYPTFTNCGDEAQYSSEYIEDVEATSHVLHITGQGEMWDYLSYYIDFYMGDPLISIASNTKRAPSDTLRLGNKKGFGNLPPWRDENYNRIEIEDGITYIGNNAFYYCGVDTLVIPASVTEIGESILSYAYTNEISVIYEGTQEQWNAITIGANNEKLLDAVGLGENNLPVITTQPEDRWLYLGKNIIFYVIAQGEDLSYQWQFSKDEGESWTNFPGKTSSELKVTASNTNNGCLYRCVISNSVGSVVSDAARLTVQEAPEIIGNPVDASGALGERVVFGVDVALDDDNEKLSYQWLFSKNNGESWSIFSGKTSQDLFVTATETNNGCLYRCDITYSGGVLHSDAARLTLIMSPVIVSHPEDANGVIGEKITFSTEASTTDSGGELVYQWQFSKDGGETWKRFIGKTSSELTVTAGESNNGCLYRCVVTNFGGDTITNAARLTLIEGLKIINNPVDAGGVIGERVVFNVVATAGDTGEQLSYQWQFSKNEGETWRYFSGKTSPELKVIAGESNDGCLYRCVVSYSTGSVTSEAVRMTLIRGPEIISNPEDVVCAEGARVNFNVEATPRVSGHELSYQWEFSKNNGETWKTFSGKTTSRLRVTAGESNDGCLYRCVVTEGSASTVSEAARLIVEMQ